MKLNKKLLLLTLLGLLNIGFAETYNWTGTSSSSSNMSTVKTNTPKIDSIQPPEYLSPEKAFLFSARMLNKNTIEVKWGADEGYHLYHDAFKFEIISNNVKLGTYTIPHGKQTFIPVLGKSIEEHTGVFSMLIPVIGKGKFTLKASGQGCADKGLCYPPFIREQELEVK